MSSTINSSGPSNSIKSFDVGQVLETLRTPLEALKTLVDGNTVEARRKKLRNLSTPTESSQAVAQENPYRGKALQTILSGNSSEPIDQNDFLATVKQIKETCAEHKISDNYSLFDQLEKLHSTGINFTGKEPYAQLAGELRLGIIAIGAKEVLGQLAIGEYTEPHDKLVKVLKFIEQELSTASSVQVDSSLVNKFALSPSQDTARGAPADPSLQSRLGDPTLAQFDRHNVKMLLKSAQDWRAENGGQSADNSQLKEPSPTDRLKSLFSRRFFERK
jgi:hypothetical protein